MKFLREQLDKQAKLFEKGGKLEKLYPLYEAQDTFLYTPDMVTSGPAHVRDAIDLKRMMITVVVALAGCTLMACYNTGLQAHEAIANGGANPLDSWQTAAMGFLGLSMDPGNHLANFIHGALYFLPVYIVTLAAGGLCEALFAIVRKHEINEGFLVTSMLYPLTLPPTIPYWQVALGIIFGVVVGKEIFGGTGMNIFNPALMSRAFLFFAYPGQISGDKVWVAVSPDGYSGATWLARAAENGYTAMQGDFTLWVKAFFGLIPGSMGETSAFFCLLGAALLIITKVGSWRVMASCVLGSLVMVLALNVISRFAWSDNPFLTVPVWWHWVLGSFAFATVYMATDPVSASSTNRGRYVYGFLIGVFGIIIRVINPAYPEGWMLAILFMNAFAPLIDYYVMQANIKRRTARYA